MADVFDTCLRDAGTMSTDPKELSAIISRLFGPSGAEFQISEELDADPDCTETLLEYLALLDISTHTLTWISVLIPVSKAITNSEDLLSPGSRPVNTFVARMHDLAQKGTALHIRIAFHHFTELCRNTVKVMEKIESEEMRVSVLRSLVQSLQRACPNNRILTPVHAEVMRLSLCIVKTSGSLVEEVYTRYAVRGSYLAFLGKCCPACASEYVLFYWYAGKIALSMGRYGEAVRLLRLVVSSPREVCFGTSEVQVSAFRLLVISSLVSEGSFSEELLLGTISEVAQRINDTCREYIKLEKVFSKGNIGAFEGYITENSEVWKRDGTEELIGVLRSSFFRHKIVRFSRIYSSANFSDVARYIGIQGGDSAVIIALIADAKSAGVVNAEIDASGCTVAFRDSQQKNVGDIDEKTSSLVVLSGTATRVKHAVIIRDFDETKSFCGYNFEYVYKTNENIDETQYTAARMFV